MFAVDDDPRVQVKRHRKAGPGNGPGTGAMVGANGLTVICSVPVPGALMPAKSC